MRYPSAYPNPLGTLIPLIARRPGPADYVPVGAMLVDSGEVGVSQVPTQHAQRPLGPSPWREWSVLARSRALNAWPTPRPSRPSTPQGYSATGNQWECHCGFYNKQDRNRCWCQQPPTLGPPPAPPACPARVTYHPPPTTLCGPAQVAAAIAPRHRELRVCTVHALTTADWVRVTELKYVVL